MVICPLSITIHVCFCILILCAGTCEGKQKNEDEEISKLHNNFVSTKNEPTVSNTEKHTESKEYTKALDKSRDIFTSPIKSLKEDKRSDVWSGTHKINDKRSFIHRKNQISRKGTGLHQEFVRHRRIFRRRQRRNHRKRNNKINFYRKNRRRKYRRRFHSSQRYRKRYRKYSRKVIRRRKYRPRHYSRRRNRRFRGKFPKLWIKKRTWHRRKVYSFRNIKTYKNSRLRGKHYKKGINKIFWNRGSKFRFRNYNRGRNRKISSKIYHKFWIRHSFRCRRKYRFRRRHTHKYKKVHIHYRKNWYKQGRQGRLETTPIYKTRQRLWHSAMTRHVSGWLPGFGKRGIVSIPHRIEQRRTHDRKQHGKTQRIRKHIDWIKQFQRRYTNLKHRKHRIQQRRRYYENPYIYTPNHFPHRRTQSLSLNEKAYTSLQHSGKTSIRYSHRTRYIKGKKRENKPNINHYRKSQLLRKKMYKEHGDGIGKQYKADRLKDTMLPTYDHHSLATTPGVRYDSGSSDSVPDEKHPWVF